MSREQDRIKKQLEKNPIVECNKIQKRFYPELFRRFELTELETNAENASNAEEAICCYLQYGESSPQRIWDDILLGYTFGNNK